MSASTALVAVSEPRQQTKGFWRTLGRGCLALAGVLGRSGQAVGKAAVSAYVAVDPDFRTHITELPVVGMSMLMPRPGMVTALPDDGYRPLILAHGLGGRPGNFVALRAFFWALGRRRVYLVDFTGARSYEEMASRLTELINGVVECNKLPPDAKIDLVTHSMGGLVARLTLLDQDMASRVHTLVTLGAPHSGSYLARYAATEVILGLRPRSELLQKLDDRALEALLRDVNVVACWSPSDVFVLPSEGSQLSGAQNVEMHGVTHYGFLIRPSCFKAVFEILQGRLPA